MRFKDINEVENKFNLKYICYWDKHKAMNDINYDLYKVLLNSIQQRYILIAYILVISNNIKSLWEELYNILQEGYNTYYSLPKKENTKRTENTENTENTGKHG